MNKWFYFNLFVLFLAIWNVVNSIFTVGIQIHILAGIIGVFLILFNWTRHAVFSTIRSHPDRATKIKFANLSKKVMPYHRWIGTTALFIIMIHATLVLNRFGFYWQSMKQTSGLVTGLLLASMVTTGWMRLLKPSGKKRMAHLYLGLLLFSMIVVHLIL